MEELNKDIGRRLREIRFIANEGSKLSARQFAFLLGETSDKILNYENGRASVSVSLLINLYRRGFNPIYILTGEGNIFADNEEGVALQLTLQDKSSDKINTITEKNDSLEDLLRKAQEYNVAAGNILKTIEKKREL